MLLAVLSGLLLVLSPCCEGDESRDLAKFQTEFFNWRMSDRPGVASSYDVLQYDDQLESYDMAKFDVRKKKADEFYANLGGIDRSKLTREEKVSYDMLSGNLKIYIDGYEWRFYQYLTSPSIMGGPQYGGSSIASEAFYTHGDFFNLIIRLEKAPKMYDEMIAMMREAVRLNRTNNEWSMKGLKNIFLSLNVSKLEDSEFYVPFKDKLNATSFSEADKDYFRSRGRTAVQGVVDGLMKMWTFLEEEYLPNTRPAVGVGSLDNGQEYYKALIKWYLSVDMTAQEVHDIGLREVDRIAAEMMKIIKKQGFEGTIREYYEKLLNDPAFTFNTSEDVLTAYREIVSNAQRESKKYFRNIPGLPLEVKAAPFPSSPIAYYSGGSADGARPGIFYVNNHKPNEVTNFTMMAIALHEATPGHHMQIGYGLLADVPDFRRKQEFTDLNRAPFAFGSYTAYIEGWGLYAEALGVEMNLYRDEYELMGRYSLEMLRACRLVVDTGMHALGWTRDRAIEHLKNNTAEPMSAIIREINRYITIPGQALTYKIGEMKIWEFRRKAEQKLGRKFDVKAFHSVVLDQGAMTLKVLGGRVDDWINEVLAEKKPVPCAASSYVRISAWVLLPISLLVAQWAC